MTKKNYKIKGEKMKTQHSNPGMSHRFLKKSIFTLFLTLPLLFISSNLFSQSFDCSPVSSSTFPKVGVTVSATDAGGNAYEGLTLDDFTVLENGINMSASMSMSCRKDTVDPELSVILLIDNTASMGWPDSMGGKRFEWALEGAKAFINTIKFVGRTKLAIMTFNNSPSVKCKFTNNKQELLDSLKYIKWVGQTWYTEAFCNPLPDTAAAFYFDIGNQPPGIKRVIVFLTDGEPTREPDADRIIKDCNDHFINVYCITMAFPMHDSLTKVSMNTGGKAYAVYTKEELREIYHLIALDLMTKRVCDLTWISQFGCKELDRIRDVSVTFKKLMETKKRRYTAPPKSTARIELSNTIISFGDPPATTSVKMTVVITAREQKAIITGMDFKPPGYYQVFDWGGSPPPIVLDTNQSRTITLQFNQGVERIYRYCTATIQASPCDQEITLVGGLTKVMLVEPQSGMVYSSCDEGIDIKWAGVESTTAITISYSTDSGNNWKLLRNNATGLSFFWSKNYNPPPPKGKNLRVKVSVQPQPSYMAAVGFGDSLAEKGLSLALTKDGHFVYAAGYFDSTFNVGTQQLEPVKYRDGFIVQYDEDLNFRWATKIGSPGRDSITGVCVDAEGNALVTGVCYNGVVFGTAMPSNLLDDRPYCFVAKFRKSDGWPMNYNTFGADKLNPNFEMWGNRIKHDEVSGKTFIYGAYRYKFSSKNPNRDPSLNLTYAPIKPLDSILFWGVVKPNFDWDTLTKITFPNYAGYSTNNDRDANGNLYGTGGFRRDTSFGNIRLTNHGSSDAYIYKFGGPPGSSDECTGDFSLIAPTLTVSATNEAFGNCTLGNSASMTTPITVTYLGPPKRISFISDAVTGNNAADFISEWPLRGTTIDSGQTKQLQLSFAPTDVGLRTAVYTIKTDCALEAKVDLTGTGICTSQIISGVDMGSVELNRRRDTSITCIIKNINPPPSLMTFSPKVVPSNSDFHIFDLQGNQITQKTLVSGDCMAIMIKFIPTAIGIRTAQIDFQLPEGCIKEFTTLTGNGISSDVAIYPVHFPNQRVLSDKDTNVVVSNNGTFDATIEYIELENKNDPNFKLTAAPISVKINSKQSSTFTNILRFTPQGEGTYTNTLVMKVDNNDSLVKAPISGTGILPKIAVDWRCPVRDIRPGDSDKGTITVSNPSKSMDLFVSSVDFKQPNSGEFLWTGANPKNFVVPIDSFMTFDVIFKPTGPGYRNIQFNITHDAAPGNDPVRKDTVTDAKCDGVEFFSKTPIDWGTILICDELPMAVTVNNNADEASISIKRYYFDGADSSAFDVQMAANFTIQPKDSKIFYIIFKPKEYRKYSTVLHLVNSIGQDVAITLNGSTEIIHLYTTQEYFSEKPGQNVTIPVKAKIDNLTNQFVDTIEVQITYDPKMQRPLSNTNFVNKLGDTWQWDVPVEELGKFQVKGYSNLKTPFDGELFTLVWEVFLAGDTIAPFYFKPIMRTCNTVDTLGARIIVSDFCGKYLRLVTFGKTHFSLSQPNPNPIDANFEVNFGIGFECNTKLEVYDSFGNKVATLVDEVLKSADYNYSFSANSMPSGVYFLRMTAGVNTFVQKMVVAR
ncbi:MAG: Choice-of-anchor protein [Ignavibacteria bacterium]|nr:Choice-of-anchor protein [Ignavibacteria bacterium]